MVKKFVVLFFIIVGIIMLYSNKNIRVKDLTNMNIIDVKEYCDKVNLKLEVEVEYSDNIESNRVIRQHIKDNDILKVTVSLGKNLELLYKKYNVNELGNVPIMMYHGIQNITNNNYIGGNIDKDGYQRTAESFKQDLEFYYNNGYRMIRLIDYVNGLIDVEIGFSPIIITFDDGLSNNIKVTDIDSNGQIIIDPNSAIGILEEFKNKYPDYNITATFFINDGLFYQPEYNTKIINWLIEHNYDIGNHTLNHADLQSIDGNQVINEIGGMYHRLKDINTSYVPIVALPFGKPYNKNNDNFKYILSGNDYETLSTLRVGWESELSPFNQKFDKAFLKRIRAYDNNGLDFDISYNFKVLENNRYISDGDVNNIVIPKDKENDINKSLLYILY